MLIEKQELETLPMSEWRKRRVKEVMGVDLKLFTVQVKAKTWRD